MVAIEFSKVNDEVRKDLAQRFSQAKSLSLSERCRLAEGLLIEAIRHNILAMIDQDDIDAKAFFVDDDQERFIYRDSTYSLLLVRHSQLPSVLSISIRSVHPSRSNFIRTSTKVEFDSYGKFNEIRVSTEAIFVKYREPIAALAKDILETGYRWLALRINSEIDSLQKRTSTDLYLKIRELLPEQVANNIWLYVITDEKGIYIPDLLSRQQGLAKAAKRDKISQSPVELLADFAEIVVNYDLLGSKIAIERDVTHRQDVSEAKYTPTGIHLAEEAIIQTRDISIIPLVREGTTLLTAACPSWLLTDTEVEEVLRNHRRDFKDIVTRNSSVLKRTVRQLQEQGLLSWISKKDVEKISKFIGMIVKEIVTPD